MSLHDEKAALQRHQLAVLEHKLEKAGDDYRRSERGKIVERDIAALKEKLKGKAL